MRRIWLCIIVLSGLASPARSQRTYKASSVLASGTWYKISVSAPGVYKIDVPFLKSLGINTNDLSSASIHLFGNGGAMLPEPCNGTPRIDDLLEDGIDIEDGGDGVFSGADYLLFYAPGPQQWVKDSLTRQFSHVKNLYTNTSFYFLEIGALPTGPAKRVANLHYPAAPNTLVTSYNERFFHELDTINFLSSGKQWYGEEFASIPGASTTWTFPVTLPNLDSSQPLSLTASCMARSIGIGSRFNTAVNNTAVSELDIPAVTDGEYDVFGKTAQSSAPFHAGGSNLSVGFDFTPGGYNAQGWLDWFELSGRGFLTMNGLSQLLFRDWNSVGNGNVGAFSIQAAGPSTKVWDITDPSTPVNMAGALSGTTFSFANDCSILHEYVAFSTATISGAPFLTPVALGPVADQNLHQASRPDLLIITDPTLVSQAQRLAQFHLQLNQFKTQVVTCAEVYNEFAGGNPDPVALRDYVKMFYDRSGGDSTKRPRYLLLFGTGSFDYQNRIIGNINLVPAYESAVSLDPLNTYTSDDFYGFLADNEDINAINAINLLYISVGRIPARNPADAAAVVDKILNYAEPKTQGPWRNELTLIADDGDQNLHFNDAEAFAATLATTAPIYNLDKIYLDAYTEEVTPAGGRYPLVNQAITNQVYSGTLVWNYTGHGSNSRLSNEDILDQTVINGFNNPDKLPLFITATCDFAPYDNPLIQSIGANLLIRPTTGAIALMTTTRLVFAFSNEPMNDNYLQIAFQPRSDGSYYSLGDAERLAKNYTYQTQTDAVNNRKFTLLGDPALTLAFPRYKVMTTAINGTSLLANPPPIDTLKALNTCSISGMVTDNIGDLLRGFNGTLYATVFDKPRTVSTLANSAGSIKADFQVQDNVLYKGKVQVSQGKFTFSFVVPKDINYQYGKGKISYYANSGGFTGPGAGTGGSPPAGGSTGPGAAPPLSPNVDANGAFTGFLVGGSGNGTSYTKGPSIQAYLNDEKFVDGGITNQTPILILRLEDSVGINVTGLGIGHDITAILDNNTQNPFVLNSFYQADLNTYKKGTVRFPLPAMQDGEHSLLIRAWDAANNSGQTTLSFRVIQSSQFTLTHVLNYPNPFSTHTTFWFEHNRPMEDLQVMVQIMTVSGKVVKSIRRTINSPGDRSSEIEWDGRDDYGAKIGKGVYVYRLRVRASDGSDAEVFQTLYIL
jgi:Peptidase family C25